MAYEAILAKKSVFEFRSRHFIFCLLICLLSYSSLIFLPAFNADDIIQSQRLSSDARTFAEQGRWAYYIIYSGLFYSNFTGPFAGILGIILLCFSALLSARAVGVKAGSSIAIFLIVSTNSLYIASFYSYDSTRIAYPLSLLAAALAVYLMQNGYSAASIFVFSFAPALFPASAQVAATIVFAAALNRLLMHENARIVLRSLAHNIVCLLVGMILYVLITRYTPIFTGVPLSGRSGIDVIAALKAHDRFIEILVGHGLPNGGGLYYFNTLMSVSIYVIVISAFTAIIFNIRRDFGTSILAALCLLGLFIAPFSLAFVSPSDDFGPRALIAYSFLHASLASVVIDNAIRHTCWRLACAPIVASFLLTFSTAVAISQQASDEYITSRNDFFATNRVLVRIEEAAASAGIPIEGPIPLVVMYRVPISMASTGAPGTARAAPWSREWIFRHIDPRITPVPEPRRTEIAHRFPAMPSWPSPGSIQVDNGIVVVNLN